MFSSSLFCMVMAASSLAAPIAPSSGNNDVVVNSTISDAMVSPFFQRGRQGACGKVHFDDELIVALPLEFYPVTSSFSPLCETYIEIVNSVDNSSVIAKVADASGMNGLLSISIGAYQALNGPLTSIKTVTWSFVDKPVNALIASVPAPVAVSSSAVAAPLAPTSTFIAPAPTSTPIYVAPSSTYVAPSPNYVALAPAPTSAAPSRGQFSGRATYYNQEGGIGSCGNANSDSAFIVAISATQYEGSKCGQQVRVTRPSTGQSVVATMADKCPGCASGSLDLSVAAFNSLGSEAEGVFMVEWSWM